MELGLVGPYIARAADRPTGGRCLIPPRGCCRTFCSLFFVIFGSGHVGAAWWRSAHWRRVRVAARAPAVAHRRQGARVPPLYPSTRAREGPTQRARSAERPAPAACARRRRFLFRLMPIRYAHARARRGDAERPARAAWAARRLLANVADFLFTSGWGRTLERSAAPGERSEVRVFANDRQILQHGHSRDDRADARHGHYNRHHSSPTSRSHRSRV